MYKKQKKIVNIPENNEITMKDYLWFSKYGFDLCTYHILNYNKSKSKLMDKLKEKGFVDDLVAVVSENGSISRHNLIVEILDKLEDSSILDEDYQTESIIDSMLDSGKSVRNIRQKMLLKGFDKDKVDDYLASKDDDVEFGGLDNEARKIMCSSKYEKASSSFERRNVLYQKLAYKGFKSSLISDWLSDNFED